MKNFRLKSRKGFTLIELLIVIAIIAILAVALLPNIFGAPQAKARDAQRVTDLEKIQNALVSAKNFDGVAYPVTVCLKANTAWDAKILAYLGNKIPVDPSNIAFTVENSPGVDVANCTGSYAYVANPINDNTFSFGLYAKMETKDSGNIDCDTLAAANGSKPNFTALPPSDTKSCYAILVK